MLNGNGNDNEEKQEARIISLDEAQATLVANRDRTLGACNQELVSLLAKYNCVLIPQVSIIGEKISTRVVLTIKQ